MLQHGREHLCRLYEEELQDRPKTPSLTEASFANRQLAKLRATRQHLSSLKTLRQILTFGLGKLGREEDREDFCEYIFCLVQHGHCPYLEPEDPDVQAPAAEPADPNPDPPAEIPKDPRPFGVLH